MSALEKRLEAIVNADPRKLWGVVDDETGRKGQLSPVDWPDDIAQAVGSITENQYGSVNVRFHDKARAADQLAKIRGLYKNEEKSKNPFEEILKTIPREHLVLIVSHLIEMGDISIEDGDDDLDEE